MFAVGGVEPVGGGGGAKGCGMIRARDAYRPPLNVSIVALFKVKLIYHWNSDSGRFSRGAKIFRPAFGDDRTTLCWPFRVCIDIVE